MEGLCLYEGMSHFEKSVISGERKSNYEKFKIDFTSCIVNTLEFDDDLRFGLCYA
jgi:hypothetical protein